jgi:hypothetical protein
MAESQELLKLITQEIDTNKFEDEHWEGSFSQYLERIDENPFIVRTAHQRVRRTASASAPSSPRTRRTRTPPSSPATSTTARSPSIGSDSDPRAFNFDGEFNIANRGIIEFIEILKLDVAFLYDLLGATQEHKIKPKKFAQTDIDEVIIGHTNEPEYKKLQNNEFMEAFRDRTVKIDIPYNRTLATRSRSTADFNAARSRQAHRAAHPRDGRDVGDPHPPRGAEEAQPHASCRSSSSTTARRCPASRGQRQGAPQGGRPARAWTGISPRYIQDKISNALVRRRGLHQPLHGDERAGGGPRHHSLINERGDRKRYRELLGVVKRGVRGHRQERGPARDLGRRGGHQAPLRQLHRQRQGLHPARRR